MNYIKLQADMIKDIEAASRGKRVNRYGYTLRPATIWVTVNGHYGIAVPFDNFYLDMIKVFPDQIETRIGKILRREENDDIAVDTRTIKTVELYPGRKEKLRIFKCRESNVYVNDAYLKYFDLDGCTFRVRDQRSTLFIFKDNELVGFVFPVIINEEKINE